MDSIIYKLLGLALFDFKRNQNNKHVFKWHYTIISIMLWLFLLPFFILQFLKLFTFLDMLQRTLNSRSLSELEQEELKRVYANSINYNIIKIKENSNWAKFASRFVKSPHLGFVLLNTVRFSRKIKTLQNDRDMAWLVHEVMHVSQYQKCGIIYIIKALRAQRNGGYAYQHNWLNSSLKDFNFEQQAEIAKHFFLDKKSDKLDKKYSSLIHEIRAQKFI